MHVLDVALTVNPNVGWSVRPSPHGLTADWPTSAKESR